MNKAFTLEIPEDTLAGWQEVADLLAELAGVPAALIMRLNRESIEVCVSSHSEGNPYKPGDQEFFENSGLYCERVIKSRDRLLVPDALADPEWRSNPDVSLNMISYLGFPLLLPGEKPFGTICILDSKANIYNGTITKLMMKFKNFIESNLELIYMNHLLGEQNSKLTDYIRVISTLKGLVPICANCKDMRNSKNEWHPLEYYYSKNPELDFTHGCCPKCVEKLYGDLDEK
jgi:transcriptional regulator with GAF, ATPase, and Fis domain